MGTAVMSGWTLEHEVLEDMPGPNQYRDGDPSMAIEDEPSGEEWVRW